MYFWRSSPELVPRSTLHSTQIPTEQNNWSGQNRPGFVNDEIDKLIDDVEVELDPEVRRGYWQRIQQIYSEELPALPLYFRAEPYILPRWLTGVEPTGHLEPTTLWVEHWRAEE